MLQEFLRRGKKWAHKPGSNFKEGSSAELGICSRPVWGSAYGVKTAMEVVDFAVDFCGGCFGHKVQRKIRR